MKWLKRNLPLVLVLAGAGLLGCNKSSPSAPTVDLNPVPPGPGSAVVTAPRDVPTEATPDQVVTVFLDAMRSGDAPTVETLLTVKAREETRRHQMPVEPMAAPNAQFQVAAAQYLPMNPDGAHVQAQWIESDGMMNHTHTVIWVLRRQTEGWRVAGFAIELVAGQGPQFLNFEDPADMMKKYKEALAANEAAQQPPVAQQAAQPPPPTNPIRQ
jgi:hypothetical protein